MKNKKYMFILSILFIVLIIIVAVQGCMLWNLTQEKNNSGDAKNVNDNNNNVTYTATDDALRFKQDYEALNDTPVEEGGENYNTVNIPEENPIVYIDLEDYVNIINSDEESYIYMSSADCPYCRATVGTLLEVVKDLGIKKLYYYDLETGMNGIDETIRQDLINQLIDKGFVTKREDGSESWRIPLIAKTRAGEVLVKNIGTSISYKEGQSKYAELTEEQKQELYNNYYELLSEN